MTAPRLTEILAHLPAGLAENMMISPPTPSQFTRERLNRRDAALRQAAACLQGMSTRAAAVVIARALLHHLAHPPRPALKPFDKAIAQVARLNMRQTLGDGQIRNVLRGARNFRG